jgi:hypothetical protein
MQNDEATGLYLKNFALRVFAHADNEERDGRSTKETARTFYSAAIFMDLLKVFGDLDNEVSDAAPDNGLPLGSMAMTPGPPPVVPILRTRGARLSFNGNAGVSHQCLFCTSYSLPSAKNTQSSKLLTF